MSDINIDDKIKETDIDFEVIETTEATALEEMGASTTIDAGSTCSSNNVLN